MMILTALVVAALIQAQPVQAPASPDPVLDRLVALYDEVCLQAFPIDGGVDKLMIAKGATALTPEQVRVTLVDDPGRGWIISDGLRDTTVMLELPPFHACSVRRYVSSPLKDVTPYRAVVDRFERGHPGFVGILPRDLDRGAIHIHVLMEGRVLPGGTTENLMFIEQTTTDATQPNAGFKTIEYRFVHQIRAGS